MKAALIGIKRFLLRQKYRQLTAETEATQSMILDLQRHSVSLNAQRDAVSAQLDALGLPATGKTKQQIIETSNG